MRVAFITRSTLYKVRGGDTLQVAETARHLEKLGIRVDILLTNENIDYDQYDLLHFFNVIRPADILCHIHADKPFVVSTLLVDYSGYDKHHRKGLFGQLCRFLSPNAIEYCKTIARYLLGKDELMTKSYLWKGHAVTVQEVLSQASLIFPNSGMESRQLAKQYHFTADCIPIPNGLDTELFSYDEEQEKQDDLVLCVARIEGIKNQLNLIRALNDTKYRLLIIGDHAPGHVDYYKECRKIAGTNVEFIQHLPQQELVGYYQKAKVHILPSWFETCGLSSLEAGAMGCNIVITDKGYTREYYGDYAFYCDPGNPDSILEAVDKAARSGFRTDLRKKILTNYTWGRAAAGIARGYDKILHAR